MTQKIQFLLSILKDYQSKPINEDFTGEVADAVNLFVAYLEGEE